MRARFTPLALWSRLTSTYWFLPAVLTLTSIALALTLTAIDRSRPDPGGFLTWTYGGGPDGARSLLSAVAGSIITVVSVTFSVTVVALTVSSQHFGPRLLNNFMRDTAAQVVLGTFIGTFVYCLVVLRAVEGETEGEMFVPQIAVTGAVGLTLVSVAALIYYIHHVSMSMQVSEITSAVTRDFERAIERLYPEPIGEDEDGAETVPTAPEGSVGVSAAASGYMQHLETDQVIELARKHDLVIWLQVRPGDFVLEETPLAVVHPRPRDAGHFARELNDACVVGADRTPDQDAAFAVQQLVEVALRALSTGLNEPFTVITCIDRLTQGLAKLAKRRIPSRGRKDRDGTLRVVAEPYTFVELLGGAFEPIRLHAERNPAISERLLQALVTLARLARRSEDRAAIRREADVLWRTAKERLEPDADTTEVHRRYQEVLRSLDR